MTRITLLSAATSLLVMAMILRDIEAKACSETSELCGKNYFGPACEIPCRCLPQRECENDGSCKRSSSRSCSPGYTGRYCTKTDMASRKITSQSTTRNNSYPEHAVDRGNPETCSSTHPNDPAPQWSVDLGRSREIYHFYLNSGYTHRMRYLTVYVSNSLTVTPNDICYSTGQELILPRSEMVCKRPMIGRYLIIRRTSLYQNTLPGVIYLCDLKITECEPRTFGSNCQNFCNCYNKQEVCRADGNCTSGCKCGYHGYQCLDECPDGTFGYNCSSTCHCKDDSPCRKSDGLCPHGCKRSWTGYTCQNHVCNSDQFRCGNEKCISMSVKCDGTDDCGDDSDEYNCPDHPTCSTYQFRCDNGNCQPMSFKCDGLDDCGDNSDEYNCPGCGSSQFRCANGLCIGRDEDCPMTKGAIVGTAFGVGLFVLVIAFLAVGVYYIKRRRRMRRMLLQRGANMTAVSTVLPQATPPPYTSLQNPPNHADSAEPNVYVLDFACTS